MTLQITGKHMDIGDAFRTRIEDRIEEATQKYFDRGHSAHVTVEKSGSLFSSDIYLKLDSGTVLQARGEAHEPIASFDAAAERIEKRLRRYKRKLKSHHNGAIDLHDIPFKVMTPIEDSEEEIQEDFAPAIIAETSLSTRAMSVADAVMALDMQDEPVFVFKNASSDHINMVYRRSDGNIGWVDPGS